MGRILCAGLCLGLVIATCLGLAVPACYNEPRPDCGFVCGPGGACPADYTCASDHRCHLAGTPTSLVCATDAGVDGGIDSPGSILDGPTGDATDTTAPTVLATSPANNDTGRPVDTTLTATFSEAVTGVSTASFTLAQGTTPIPGAVGYNAATHIATFTPNAQLPASSTITARLASPIADLAGNPLATYTWTFDTGNDTVAPALVSSVPMNNDTAVATSSTVTVVFDEPMANVTTATFTIDDGVTMYAGTVTTSDNVTFVLTPTAALPAATQLTVTLTGAITDTAGNHLATTTFTFTTA